MLSPCCRVLGQPRGTATKSEGVRLVTTVGVNWGMGLDPGQLRTLEETGWLSPVVQEKPWRRQICLRPLEPAGS